MGPAALCVEESIYRAASCGSSLGSGCAVAEPMQGGPHVWLSPRGLALKRPAPNTTLALANCGGLACVFSRGMVAALPPTELEQCGACVPGMADQQLSYCVFFTSGVGPIGLPSFSWGAVRYAVIRI